MNAIIRSFLDNHSKEYELKLSENDAFEHFVNYIILRNYTSRHFDPSIICTDEGEMGIDGVAIIVNDVIVSSEDEVEDIFKNSAKEIKVDFVFTQAKTSESFDSSEISIFLLSVRNFFDRKTEKIKMNQKMDEMVAISDFIFRNAIKLEQNPSCHLYYASTGIWQSADKLQDVINDGIARFKEMQLFNEIDFIPYDQKRISSSYREIKNNIKKQIDIEFTATVPVIKNVKEAYIGLARCKDYVKLISNEDGKLITSLFEDNVRYFQGNNTVNMEISGTLDDENNQKPFPLLNNGVTIVAKDIRRTGNSFVLSDFQIVNGCQTSFVLYENRDKLKSDTFMVIKLVSTEDQELTGCIIKATNRQTPVLTEAFETLRDFHKNLELAYGTYEGEYRLYYERRSKQYDSLSINKNKIVSFAVQINSFVAMFLGEPQSTHRYYGELLESNKKRIFRDDDILEQYCISTIFLYYVEKWIRNESLEKKYKAYRYHLILILRCLICSDDLPRASSKKMNNVCKKLYNELIDNDKIDKHMNNAIKILNEAIEKASKAGLDVRNLSRTKELTNYIIKIIGGNIKNIAQENDINPLLKNQVFDCLVTGYNRSFVYVEIIEHKEHGYIHIGELEDRYINSISEIVKKGDKIKAVLLDEIPDVTYGYKLSKKKAESN